jgi:hypothetical protein
VAFPLPGRIVQKDLDIQEYTDPEKNAMIPHTLVLKPALVIYRIYNGYWFWGRPSVADLWHAGNHVSQQRSCKSSFGAHRSKPIRSNAPPLSIRASVGELEAERVEKNRGTTPRSHATRARSESQQTPMSASC